jgi:predicted TIM-barrel fold metal-dependent hydrolase
MDKIWANSGDSHLVEPEDIFETRLPGDLASRMPRIEKDPTGAFETIRVDGQKFCRRIPRMEVRDPETGLTIRERAPGANDPYLRLKDLDEEGIWAELIFPSFLIWTHSIKDPALVRAGARAINDWSIEFQQISSRFVCAATIPFLAIGDAVEEIHRAAKMGFKAGFIPVAAPTSQVPFQHGDWDPVWGAFEEEGMVVAFHTGTEPHDAGIRNGHVHRGPGGALLNYYETSFGAQRAVAALISGGALDRFPNLRVIVSEGGATWGPFLADRLDEGYRQHQSAVRPKLRRMPSEYLYTNIYASFQHDRSAVLACSAMGWSNVCWGSDYPHIEGTYGHTQKTLHELVDGIDPGTRSRVTVGAFKDLFPHIPDPPA